MIYYVDNAGNDGNPGTSSSPWKTCAKVNAFALQPGDTVLFKRGGLWRETLAPTASGTSGNPITFGAYGTGADPMFKGSDVKANAAFTLQSGTTYQTAHVPENGTFIVVRENGVRLTPQASLAACNAATGSSFYSANVLYVNPTGGGSVITNGRTYEAGTRQRCVWTNGRNRLVFEDLTSRHHCGQQGGFEIGGFNNTMRRCDSRENGYHSLLVISATGAVIEDCTFDEAFSGLMVFFQSTGCVMRRCTLDATHTWGAQLCQMHGTGCTNNVIEHCLIRQSVDVAHSSAFGVQISDAGCTNNTVRFNRFEGYLHASVSLNTSTTGNLAYGNVSWTPNAKSDAYSVFTGSQLTAYNNTVYMAALSLYAFRVDATSTLTLRNNALQSGLLMNKAAGATFSSNYNRYYSLSATPFNYQGSFGNFATWQSSSGQDANSTFGDPLFTDAATGDLTPTALSPLLGAGTDLGDTYASAVSSDSEWPDDVELKGQAGLWNIGAYVLAAAVPTESTRTLTLVHTLNGVPSDPDNNTVLLSDPTGTFGARVLGTNDIVVEDATPMVRVSTGVYEYVVENTSDTLEWYAEYVVGGLLRRRYFTSVPAGDHYASASDVNLELGNVNADIHSDLDADAVAEADKVEHALDQADTRVNLKLSAYSPPPAAFPVTSTAPWVTDAIRTAATKYAAGFLLNKKDRQSRSGTTAADASPGDRLIADGDEILQALIDGGLVGVELEETDADSAVAAPIAVGATVDAEGRDISEPPPVGVYYDRNARTYRWN